LKRLNLKIVARDQFLGFLNSTSRWAIVVAHRRAGKTVACIQKLVAKAAEDQQRQPRYAYLAPTYAQAKDVAWTYLKDYVAGIPGVEVRESELAVILPHNKARIRLYGLENYDRLRGNYLDGVVIDEAGDIDPRAWDEVIRPALSDRKGWATFIGTPKGRNTFATIWQNASADDEWFSLMLKASETGLIDKDELRAAKNQMTPEAYAQEYECSFDAAVKGAYYAKELADAEEQGRVSAKVRYDKAADVWCAWDLGIGDSTALWTFQIVGNEWHFLEAYEASGQALDHYVDWVKSRPYTIHEHLLPHDAEARELQTGKSRIDFLKGRDLKCRIIPRHGVDERIGAARVKFNRFWFNSEGCKDGLEALRMYRAEWDDKRMVLKSRPLHDWSSHLADAFGYAVLGAQEQKQAIDWPEFRMGGIV
jgi:phage terminase large subunit